jgi:hypothetical protein
VAITGAALRYAAAHPGWVLQVVAGLLLALSTGVIAYLLTVTFHKIIKGNLFLENAAAEKATAALGPAPGPIAGK